MKEDFLFNHEVALLRERGVTLNDLKGEEVVALVNAVERLRKPFTDVNLDVCGFPIEVKGGVKLWKLTVGATVWLAEYAEKWWLDEGKQKAYFWAMVYACVHSREQGVFPTNEEEAFRLIRDMAVGLASYEEDLVEGVNKCLVVRKSKAPSLNKNKAPQLDTQPDWATVVARLEGQTGIPADQWCWNRSADYALRVHEDLKHFAEQCAGHSSRMMDEVDEATRRLARMRAEIINRVEAERKEKAE